MQCLRRWQMRYCLQLAPPRSLRQISLNVNVGNSYVLDKQHEDLSYHHVRVIEQGVGWNWTPSKQWHQSSNQAFDRLSLTEK
jgi:hypothetical protein